MSFVFASLGFLMGTLLLVLVYLFTLFSCIMLLESKNYTGIQNYFLIADLVKGKKFKVSVQIVVMLQNFFICINYLQTFSNQLTYIVAQSEIASYTPELLNLITFCLMMTLVPYILARNFENLKTLSYLTTISVYIYVIFLISVLLIKANNQSISNEYQFLPNS
jgi:amino acid permease